MSYTMHVRTLPERIEPDAILEALVEFRFEHSELPEQVLGRLLDIPLWSDFAQTRLPTADIPQTIREMDDNLKYQPSVELRKDGRVVKIGGRVLSYHVLPPYPRWPTFGPEIEAALRNALTRLKSPRLSRIGFRYINVLRPEGHYVHGFQDTRISLRVGKDKITGSLGINYTRSFPDHMVTVRVATPDQVVGNIPPGFSILCDIDVTTKPENTITELTAALEWIEIAHKLEKAEFFSILPDEIIKKIEVPGGRD